ncbi:Hypothetical predicted protein [Octopus vulgaris]|uniref:C-type lectin domain-containing protein n=2 Tax=Octopus vulgaris TaxID=6645 RepID=A0AA36BYY3_OCTVU|nr:Hypothetical predicted protein [Octopus vulgaris]
MLYTFWNTKMIWYLASKFCKKYHSNLPYLKDMESVKAIGKAFHQTRIRHYKHSNYWIGLQSSSRGKGQHWEWEDGTPLSFSYWSRKYHPNVLNYHYCAYMESGSKWMSKKCVERSSVVCVAENHGWSKWTPWSACDCRTNTAQRSRTCRSIPNLPRCNTCNGHTTSEVKGCECSSRKMKFQKFPWKNAPRKSLPSPTGISSLQGCASICFENQMCTSFVKEKNECHLFADVMGAGQPNKYSFTYGYRLIDYNGN